MNPWTPERILDQARAFMEARVLLTGVDLDVFTLLSEAPKTVDETAALLNTPVRGVAILLDALAALGLLEKAEGRYSCPKELAAALSANSPESVLPMLRHAAGLWHLWSPLTDIVRTGTANRPPDVFREPGELEAFILAMHVVGRHLAGTIAERCHASSSRKLLDVGGATGTYAEAFLRCCPEMRATVFDRPPVIALAKKRLASSDCADRIAFAEGDFYADELPGGHDVALLSAIIHQNSPEQNGTLYAKVFRALDDGGRIVVRDFVLSEDRTRPVGGAMFAVNMLAATSGGNCYTFDEIRATLEAAGFERVALIQTGDAMDGLVEAFKP